MKISLDAIKNLGNKTEQAAAADKAVSSLVAQDKPAGFLNDFNGILGEVYQILEKVDQMAGIILPIVQRSQSAKLQASVNVSMQQAEIQQAQHIVQDPQHSAYRTDAPGDRGGSPPGLPLSMSDQLEALIGVAGDIKISDLKAIIDKQTDPELAKQLIMQIGGSNNGS